MKEIFNKDAGAIIKDYGFLIFYTFAQVSSDLLSYIYLKAAVQKKKKKKSTKTKKNIRVLMYEICQ